MLGHALTFQGSTIIIGTFNGDADSTYTIQFFDNPTADPSGYGQGQTLIGTTTVTTDASGNASFQASFSATVNAGDAISATATDSSGDTSEFAQDVTAVALTSPIVAVNDSYNTDINTTLHRRRARRPGQRLLGLRRDVHVAVGHDDLARHADFQLRRLVHLRAQVGLYRHRLVHL